MINFRHTVSAIAVSSLLVLAGCSGEEETTAAVAETADAAQKVVNAAEGWMADRPSKADMQSFFKVETRSNANADRALELLGVSEGPGMSWDSQSGSNGNYTYTNVAFGSGSDKLTASKMSLSGVHMAGNSASFDKMVLENAEVGNADGEAVFDRVMLADPHPEVAERLFSGLSQMTDMDSIDINGDMGEGELPFGAMMIEGAKMMSEDGEGTIGLFGWGLNETDNVGSFLVEDLAFSGTNDMDEEMSVSLGSASGKALDLSILNSMKGDFDVGDDPMGDFTGSLIVDDLMINSDAADLSLDLIQMAATKSGDVITQKMEMKPLTMKIKEMNEGAAMAFGGMDPLEVLKSVGYDEMVFTANMTATMNESTGTMIVKDTVLSMQDGFDLGLDAKMSDMENDDDPLIHNMTIAFTDRNIMEAGFELAAQMQGGNASLMRMQAKGLIGMAPNMVPPEQKELMTMVAGPMGKFIDNGGTLVFSMNPSSPMRASDLEMAAEDPAMLDQIGLTVSHRE